MRCDGDGRWAWIPGGGLRSAPYPPPTSDLIFRIIFRLLLPLVLLLILLLGLRLRLHLRHVPCLLRILILLSEMSPKQKTPSLNRAISHRSGTLVWPRREREAFTIKCLRLREPKQASPKP